MAELSVPNIPARAERSEITSRHAAVNFKYNIYNLKFVQLMSKGT